MAKLLCNCGHIIRDQTDYLPYKATFIPDEDNEVAVSETVKRIAQFIQAIESGQKEAYFQGHYGEIRKYEDDMSLLWDLISYLDVFSRLIYECENCGRLWIQKHKELDHNIYSSYLPEMDIRGVLKSQREQRDCHEG